MTVEDLTPAEKAALTALAANQQPDGCWCGVEGHPVCVVCADAARELVAAVEPVIAAERDQVTSAIVDAGTVYLQEVKRLEEVTSKLTEERDNLLGLLTTSILAGVVVREERDQLQYKYEFAAKAFNEAAAERDKYMKLTQQWRQAALEGVVRDIEEEDEDVKDTLSEIKETLGFEIAAAEGWISQPQNDTDEARGQIFGMKRALAIIANKEKDEDA